MNVNNNYKRFQSYRNEAKPNTFKQEYMEQNYKVEKKALGEKPELGVKRELPKQDTAFLKNATRLSVNSQGKFFKK